MHRAQSPAAETGGLVLTRRDLFTLLGSAAVLVACGGKSHSTSPITVSSGTPVSSGTAAGSASGGSGTGVTSAPQAANGGGNTTSGSVVKIGGQHATGSDAMSVADAQREAQVANGHWQGGWHDATGASGDSDIVIAIDAASRTAKATVSFDGKVLGAAVPTTTYDIDLLSFMMTADSYNVSSPQFGEITITPGGATNASGSGHSVPGQPAVDHIDVNGSKAGKRVDVSYTVFYIDGHGVKGTAAWTTTGERATPAALGSEGAPTSADIASGSYAAGLLDAKSLTTIFGKPFDEPIANGGNLLYGNGIATSDGQVYSTAHDYVIQYTIYVGTNAADTAAFWKIQNPGLPTTPGPWLSGFFFPGAGFYAELPTRVLLVQVLNLKPTGTPTAQQIAMIEGWTIQVATAITNSLKSS
ncbi:MAG TPA: hypothetical protein VGL75_15160 [Acidothermaceae bacterium]|jgi:hypothetical protein